MKKHYYILGLNEGASQEQIQEAYERLSNTLNPSNNNNQEFFVEEFKKVQEAYKALSNSSILATDKGAKQIFKKPNSSSKKNSDATKTPIAETPRKSVVKTDVIFVVALIAIGIAAYFIYNNLNTYKSGLVVFNKGLAYLGKDMSLFTGKVKDRTYQGEFVNGKRVGLHRSWHFNTLNLKSEGYYYKGDGAGNLKGDIKCWDSSGSDVECKKVGIFYVNKK